MVRNALTEIEKKKKIEAWICAEILEIMSVYHEQNRSSSGVDTPGGLEHMGDVWALFGRWEKALLD